MCRRLPVCDSLQHHRIVTTNDNSNSELAEIALEEVAVDEAENTERLDWVFGGGSEEERECEDRSQQHNSL